MTTSNNSMAMGSKPARHLAGEPGIWWFVFADMLFFSIFFVYIILLRMEDAPLFVESQAQLSQTWGMINTLLMLSSSWFVVSAVRAARRNGGNATPLLLSLALLCGLAFGIVKFVEWGAKFRDGITVLTNDFFMYYFIFTGIHFVHVLIGVSILAVLVYTTRGTPMDANRIGTLESGATFWHMVDLLWIILFALFYLV